MFVPYGNLKFPFNFLNSCDLELGKNEGEKSYVNSVSKVTILFTRLWWKFKIFSWREKLQLVGHSVLLLSFLCRSPQIHLTYFAWSPNRGSHVLQQSLNLFLKKQQPRTWFLMIHCRLAPPPPQRLLDYSLGGLSAGALSQRSWVWAKVKGFFTTFQNR